MKRYLLDTGPLGGLLFARSPAVALIQPWVDTGEAATSMVVYGELVEYVVGRRDAEADKQKLRALLNDVTPLDLSIPILDRYADLRRTLRPPRGPGLIGDIDTLIAATALEHDLTVVTNDGDFIRVPDLTVLLLARRTFSALGFPGH